MALMSAAGQTLCPAPHPTRRHKAIIRGLLTQPLLAVTAAVLLWLGTISLWSPIAPGVLAAPPAAAGAPHHEQVANGGGFRTPIDDGLFAVLADDDEAGDQLPMKAGLLTVMVLPAFVGWIVWGLAASGRGRLRAKKSCLLVQCCFQGVVRCLKGRPVTALLGVVRL